MLGANHARQAPAQRYAYSSTFGDSTTFAQLDAGLYNDCAVSMEGMVQCWGLDNFGQAPRIELATQSTTRVLPTATFSATPASVPAGQPFALALAGAAVPGWSGPVAFTYALDCGDGSGYGSGYGAFGTSSTASCATGAAGVRTLRGTVRDEQGDQTEYTAVVQVTGAKLSVDADGTLDRRTGGATITGTASCSVATAPTVTVSLSQPQTRGKTPWTLSGSGSTAVACHGTTTWTVTVAPASGRFAAGAASVTASAAGATPTSRTVQLN